MVELVITGASAVGVVYGFVYMSLFQPLQEKVYTDNGSIQSLTASVSDIKDNVSVIRYEVDALAAQKGIRVTPNASTSISESQ